GRRADRERPPPPGPHRQTSCPTGGPQHAARLTQYPCDAMIHGPFRFGVGACGGGAVDAGGRAAMIRPLDAVRVVGLPGALAEATLVVVGVLVGWHTARLGGVL